MKRFFATLHIGFKSIIKNSFLINKMMKFVLPSFLGLILIFSSGYALSVNNTKISIYLCAGGCLCILYQLVMRTPFAFFKKDNFKSSLFWKTWISNNKDFLFFLSFALWVIISFFVNRDFASVNGYIGFGIIIAFSYLFTCFCPFEKFVNIFTKIMTIICIISLFFFLTINLLEYNFSFNQFIVHTNNTNIYANYLNVFFVLNNYFSRNTSIFWEPGLFASMCIIGLLFEFCFKKKTNYVSAFIYFLSILTTMSTAAYLFAAFLVPIAIIEKCKSNKIKYSTVGIFFLSAVITIAFYNQIFSALASLFPTLFKKIADTTISFTTRLNSPKVNFEIFLNHPFFGFGLTKAGESYLQLITTKYNHLVNSQTSTSGFLLAAFGIGGIAYSLAFIVSITKNKKLHFLNRFIFVPLLLILMINKEPHTMISVTWILLFFFLKAGFCKKKSYPTIPENSLTVREKIFSSSNSGELMNNVVGAFIIKGLAMVIGLLTLPIYISYFGNESILGVWLTILSILTWILTFDLGIGNGLKNKLIGALAKKDNVQAKKYISSAYITIGCLSSVILIVGIILLGIFDLNSFFNIPTDVLSAHTLTLVVQITFACIVLEFFFKLIISILHALQKQAISSSLALISQSMILIFASFYANSTIETSFVSLAIFYVFAINAPLIIATIIIFSTRLRPLAPSFKFLNKKHALEIISLGGTFFIIQISLLVINSTNEILITQIFSPSAVVEYQKYFKLFHLLVTIASLVSGPIWAATAKAFNTNNLSWLKKVQNLLLKIFIGLSVSCLFLIMLLQIGFNIWLGDETINVNYFYALCFAIQTIILVFIVLWTSISNGIGALKTQFYGNLTGAIIKIPLVFLLVYIFGKGAGWITIIITNAIILLPTALFQIFENKRHFKKRLIQLSPTHMNFAKSKKVFLIAYSSSSSKDVGGPVRFVGFASAISEMGYRPVIISRANAPFSEITNFGKYDVISLQKKYKFKMLSKILSKIIFVEQLKEILEFYCNENDCLIVSMFLPSFAHRIIKRISLKRNIKVIYDAVEWFSPCEFKNGARNLGYKKNDNLIKKTLVNPISTISISTFFESYFNSVGVSTVYIPFVFDSEEEREIPHHRTEKKVFLYAGSPGHKDNLKSMLDGFALLNFNERRHIRIIVIGSTVSELIKLDPQFKDSIARLGDDIEIIGRIPREEVRRYFEIASFTMLLRPRNEIYAKAGFPTKISESLFAGIPTITNLTSDLSLYLSDRYNSILIDSNTATDFAIGIRRCLALSNNELDTMSKNARLTAETKLDIRWFKDNLQKILVKDPENHCDASDRMSHQEGDTI